VDAGEFYQAAHLLLHAYLFPVQPDFPLHQVHAANPKLAYHPPCIAPFYSYNYVAMKFLFLQMEKRINSSPA
jgi:hypothetical protein